MALKIHTHFCCLIKFFSFLFLVSSQGAHAQTKPLDQRRAPATSSQLKKNPQHLALISWNLLNFGEKKKKKIEVFKNEKNIDILARISAAFKNSDLIAVQEVNTKEFKNALNFLRTSLQEQGELLCVGFSNTSTVNTTEVERFAFIWRDSRIHYVTTQGKEVSCASNPDQEINFPLLTSVGDRMGRMPAYAAFVFRPLKKKFYYVNLHLRPSGKKPQLEVPALTEALSPRASRQDIANEQPFLRNAKVPIIISGDFNLSNLHPAFKGLQALGFKASLDNEKTSLQRKKKLLNHAYDNFWFRSGSESKIQKTYSKVHNLFELFPELEAKDVFYQISDHCPIETHFQFVD